MTWTEERIASLRQLWTEGLSAAGIAKTLGVSRSAVLGKLHRLEAWTSRKAAAPLKTFGGGAAATHEGPLAAAFRLRRPRMRRPPPMSPWKAEAFLPLAGTAPRPWLTREACECAFPVDAAGDDAGVTLSCCAPTRPRSAYCAHHHGVVFRPPPAAEIQPPAEAVPAPWRRAA